MRCEGQERRGGAFSMGPVVWKQCKADATVMLTAVQNGKEENQPSCQKCWQKALDFGITITKAVPIEVKNE